MKERVPKEIPVMRKLPLKEKNHIPTSCLTNFQNT